MVEFLNIAITVLIFILSALPLYFAVKLLGGKSSLIKATLVTVISGILVSAIQAAFGLWGVLISFAALIWIYHEIFRLKWFKALLVWLIQGIILLLFSVIVGILFLSAAGISIVLNG
ncbi:MAG TPA: hypothetical protein VJH97_04170 [Candidatus Nanoarchaeia archaeon]|nr:hypothetical protein [Candidatus Nanoarchaeia archaeon]